MVALKVKLCFLGLSGFCDYPQRVERGKVSIQDLTSRPQHLPQFLTQCESVFFIS